jgi:hypothetical protein
MKKTENNYGLVWVLLVIVVVMTVVKIKYGWRGSSTVLPLSTPVPTEVLITAVPTEASSGAAVLKVDETKYPLWQDVPFSGDGFLIDRYAAPKVLAIQLQGASTSSATKAVNAWLKTFGEAGKGHKLIFEN